MKGVLSSRLLNLICALFLAARAAWAWPPTFGPEFTFTNPTVNASHRLDENGNAFTRSPESEAAQKRLAEVIDRKCLARGDCKVERVLRDGVWHYRVTYADKWWFQIETDPAVVEVNAKPATLDQFASMEARIQEDLFNSAAEAELWPHEVSGGGHIHLGAAETFGDQDLLFRNFLVDWANQPELSDMIFANDLYNSPSISSLGPEAMARFQSVIARYDRGEIVGRMALAKAVQEEVYTFNRAGWNPPEKYQAINLTRVAKKYFPATQATVEIRSFRPQKSAKDFIQQIRLIEARLIYLREIKEPIAVARDIAHTPGAIHRRFRAFVETSGLSWADYEHLAPEAPPPTFGQSCASAFAQVLSFFR